MLFHEPHLTYTFRYNTDYSLKEEIILEEISWKEKLKNQIYPKFVYYNVAHF